MCQTHKMNKIKLIQNLYIWSWNTIKKCAVLIIFFILKIVRKNCQFTVSKKWHYFLYWGQFTWNHSHSNLYPYTVSTFIHLKNLPKNTSRQSKWQSFMKTRTETKQNNKFKQQFLKWHSNYISQISIMDSFG